MGPALHGYNVTTLRHRRCHATLINSVLIIWNRCLVTQSMERVTVALWPCWSFRNIKSINYPYQLDMEDTDTSLFEQEYIRNTRISCIKE